MPVEAIPLAIAAAFFPTGVIVFTLLVSHEPFKVRAICFLLGAWAMTLGAGVLVVSLAHDADAAGDGSATKHLSGTVDLVLGVLLLLAAQVVRRRPPHTADSLGPRTQTITRLMRSPALALVLGAAMYAPSPMYLAALKTVADAGMSSAADLSWVVFLTLIVTSLVEIPVLFLLLRPATGHALLRDLNGWMHRRARVVGAWALLLAGAYLVTRGLVRVL